MPQGTNENPRAKGLRCSPLAAHKRAPLFSRKLSLEACVLYSNRVPSNSTKRSPRILRASRVAFNHDSWQNISGVSVDFATVDKQSHNAVAQDCRTPGRLFRLQEQEDFDRTRRPAQVSGNVILFKPIFPGSGIAQEQAHVRFTGKGRFERLNYRARRCVVVVRSGRFANIAELDAGWTRPFVDSRTLCRCIAHCRLSLLLLVQSGLLPSAGAATWGHGAAAVQMRCAASNCLRAVLHRTPALRASRFACASFCPCHRAAMR